VLSAQVSAGQSPQQGVIIKLYPISGARAHELLELRGRLALSLSAHSSLAPQYIRNQHGNAVTLLPPNLQMGKQHAMVVMARLPGCSLHSISLHSSEEHAAGQVRSTLSSAHCPLAQASKGATNADDWYNVAASCAAALCTPLAAFPAPSGGASELWGAASDPAAQSGLNGAEEQHAATSYAACDTSVALLQDRLLEMGHCVSAWRLHLPPSAAPPASANTPEKCTTVGVAHHQGGLSPGYWDLSKPHLGAGVLAEVSRLWGAAGLWGVADQASSTGALQATSDMIGTLSRGMEVWIRTEVALQQCRAGWVHGDLNDCNILVTRDGAGRVKVSGIIDIDDASFGYSVLDCAILAAYGAMGCAHPVEMISAIVAGWHSSSPLLEQEVRIVPFLVLSRCVQSVLASTLRWLEQGSDEKGYLQLHMRTALALMLELLPLLQHDPCSPETCGLQQHLLVCTGFGASMLGQPLPTTGTLDGLQHVDAAGVLLQYTLPPLSELCSASPKCSPDNTESGALSVWSTPVPSPRRATAPPASLGAANNTGAAPAACAQLPLEMSPVCCYRLNASSTHVLDFSATSSLEWGGVVGFTPAKIAAFHYKLAHRAFSSGHTVAWGKYGEDRIIYASEHFVACATGGLAAEESRTLHLGVDLFLPEHSPIFAPCDGALHSFAVNGAPLDYGTAIILRHDTPAMLDPDSAETTPNPGWFSLYGHLSPRTFQMWSCRADSTATLSEADAGIMPATPVPVARGELLGWVGGPPTNGGWAPHLHFQIMSEDPTAHGETGDFAGVCKPSEWQPLYRQLVPDPAAILDPQGLVPTGSRAKK